MFFFVDATSYFLFNIISSIHTTEPKPVLDPITHLPMKKVVVEKVVDPVTNEEKTVEKTVPVLMPLPEPLKIVIPESTSGDYFSEMPLKDLRKGAMSLLFSCAAGSSFKKGTPSKVETRRIHYTNVLLQ